jgi:DNA-binding NarL/FixJ family response regulator
LIVDAFPIVRWAVRSYLEKESGISVVAEAESINEASIITRSIRPDVVVTAVRFPGSTGSDSPLDFIKSQQVPTLAFCDQDSWREVEAFINAGGLGFVSKRSPISDLVSAIRAVSGNRRWISPAVRESTSRIEALQCEDNALSPREREVVALILNGQTSRQIADQLCLSLRTVENHRHRVFKKLGIRRAAQLVDYSIKNGLRPHAECS